MADGGRSAEEREAARVERERRRAEQPMEPLGGDAFDGDGFDDDGFDDDGFDGDGYDDDHPEEMPIGIRRVERRERARRAAQTSRPRRPAARRPAAADGRGRFGRRRSVLAALIALFVVAPVLAAIWFAVELFQPFAGSPHGRVVVTIPPHTGARQIGDLLARDGVVPSGFFFDVRTLLDGDRGKLRAGMYTLKFNMTYSQALKVLITPPPVAKTSNVTIVEGETRRQVDALLRGQHIGTGYLAATAHSALLDPTQFGAPRGTNSLEGFLFPSTYQLRDPIKLSDLIADQLKTFKQRFATVGLSYAAHHHLTPYDVLIIASIVEKEAGTSHDFPLVASVVYNRLASHIPLGMDSTTRYEFNDYDKPLTQSQLAAHSPYNTRQNAGLPPTPIDSPGLAAIHAAAHPAQTNYLYFVVKPCGNGSSAFTSSYTQFLNFQQHYYSVRSRQGGNSPTTCSAKH